MVPVQVRGLDTDLTYPEVSLLSPVLSRHRSPSGGDELLIIAEDVASYSDGSPSPSHAQSPMIATRGRDVCKYF